MDIDNEKLQDYQSMFDDAVEAGSFALICECAKATLTAFEAVQAECEGEQGMSGYGVDDETALSIKVDELEVQLKAAQVELNESWLIEIEERFADKNDSKAYRYINNLRAKLEEAESAWEILNEAYSLAKKQLAEATDRKGEQNDKYSI